MFGLTLIKHCRFAAPSNPDKLEQALYPPFSAVLQADIAGMFDLFHPKVCELT